MLRLIWALILLGTLAQADEVNLKEVQAVSEHIDGRKDFKLSVAGTGSHNTFPSDRSDKTGAELFSKSTRAYGSCVDLARKALHSHHGFKVFGQRKSDEMHDGRTIYVFDQVSGCEELF